MEANIAIGDRSKLKAEAGFTYLGLLFSVAIIGVMLSGSGMLWSVSRQREKEQDLMYAGAQIRKAIGSYYLATPGIVKRFPPTFKDLLKDNRRLSTVRHLRRLYMDPITLSTDWGIVLAPDGGIKGVYSLSSGKVMKRSGFEREYARFESAQTYRDWEFVYEPPSPELVLPKN